MLSNTVNKAYALAKKAITATVVGQYLHIWFVRLLSSRQVDLCLRQSKDEK
jgi:hypothetical protein